jgi:heptosyltransferase I
MSSAREEVIAVLELGALGDSVMTLPAMQLLRTARPQAHILRVHSAAMASFFAGCPYADELLAYDKRLPKLQAAVGLGRALRARRISAFVNLHTPDFDRPFGLYLRDNLYAWLSGAPARIAYYHSLDRLLVSHGLPRHDFGGRPLDEEEVRLMASFVGLQPSKPVAYWLSAGEQAAAQGLLCQVAGEDALERGYFCVAPFTRNPTRRWPLARLARAVDEIARETGLRPVLLGTKDDACDLPELCVALHEPFVDLVGKSSIRQAAALLAGARFAIAMDSGLMHLAALTRTPLLGIFGPGNPVRWRPLPLAPQELVASGVDCAPCFRRACDSLRCQQALSVEAVVEGARRLRAKL